MSSSAVDLVIVGASFAGLTCARAAALRGLKVVVIEAKSDPGARIHTTGILVKEAAEELDVPARLTRLVPGVRLYAPDLSRIDLASPGYYFLTTDTAGLLRWLTSEARRAGAVVRCASRFDGARRDADGRIRLSGHDLACRYLVGADGARSSVAKAFGLGRNRRFLVGMEAEYRGLTGIDADVLHCFLHSALAPGYIGWIAPAPEVTQVGLATQRHARPSLEGLCRHVAPVADFSGAEIVERRSGLIPCGGLVHPFAAPGVLLIGDAAGCTSPLTGGGIHLAFRLGRRAGQLIADHLKRGGLDPAGLIAGELPRFAAKLWLRRLLDAAPPDFVWNALIGTAALRDTAHRLYFHARAPRQTDPLSSPGPRRQSPGRAPARQARPPARH